MIKQLLIRFILFFQWILKQIFSKKPEPIVEKTHEELYEKTILQYNTIS